MSNGPDPGNGQDSEQRKTPTGVESYQKACLGGLVALLTAGFGWYFYWLYSVASLADAVGQTSAWLSDVSGPRWPAHLLIIGPLLGALSVVTLLLVRFGLPNVWQSARRAALLGLLLGVCLLGAALLTSAKLSGLIGLEWVLFIPVVPPVLLGYQGLLVWRERPRNLGALSLGVSAEVEGVLVRQGVLDSFKAIHRQLLIVFGGATTHRAASDAKGSSTAATGKAYEPTYFVTNFAVPSLLLLIVGFGAIATAYSPPEWALGNFAERGLRWGVAGSFAYVLITFGSRFYQNDLTVGAATWAIITLILGPALAVTLALAWKMEAGQSPWQTGAVLFFAGVAPRRIVSIIESVALQMLKSGDESVTAGRALPLTSLRGLTAQIAIRLREENVENVSGLAYVDAIRLVQALPYDLRQVVDWIDQAQLALVLPKHYEKLRDNGVTGAIDLAWRWLRTSVEAHGDEFSTKPNDTAPAGFRALIGETDADLVYEAAAQLFYEEQVRLLWVMYNCFSTTAGEVHSVEAEDDASGAQASPAPSDSGARWTQAPNRSAESRKRTGNDPD